MIENLKSRARALKTEVHALYLAARDPRTPWYARAVIWFVVVHTLSPIDLIPDFIPVLGYLDDLIIVPAGVALAIRWTPPEVLVEAREAARQAGGPDRRAALVGGLFVFLIWAAIAYWIIDIILALRH
jgi:uncharacterized membrane protein YkvA (DUF1232 family)